MSWSGAAAFYDQVRSLLSAGLAIDQALTLAAGSAPGHYRTSGPAWARGCAAGQSLAEQLRSARESELACALVRAGEVSGRLPELCGEIAGYYRHAVALRRLMIGRLIYPTCLIHVVLMAVALPAVVFGGASGWWLLAGPTALWLVIAASALACRLLSDDALARLALIPGMRALTVPLVAGNTCLVLRAGLAAGMLMPAALDLAAGACGNRVFAARLRSAAASMVAGAIPDLTAALTACGLPAMVLQLTANGERAGKLDETLAQCATVQRESFRLRSEWTARILAGTIYGAALLAAALTVIMLYASYLGTAVAIANQVE